MNIKIAGIIGLSLIDYPGKVTGVIFLAGCNFRCPYCHNMNIVENIESLELLDVDFVVNEFKRRKKLLDAVVITGGEPTIYKDLPDFIKAFKDIGYFVKLDTNGYEPKVLISALEKNLIDFISMDIKSALDDEKYSLASGVHIDIEKIKKSIEIIRSSNIDYEFRTTIIDGFVSLEDIKEIAEYINPSKVYYLQSANKDWKNFTSPKDEDIKSLIEVFKEKGINFIKLR